MCRILSATLLSKAATKLRPKILPPRVATSVTTSGLDSAVPEALDSSATDQGLGKPKSSSSMDLDRSGSDAQPLDHQCSHFEVTLSSSSDSLCHCNHFEVRLSSSSNYLRHCTHSEMTLSSFSDSLPLEEEEQSPGPAVSCEEGAKETSADSTDTQVVESEEQRTSKKGDCPHLERK